jgi:hypothetical protein
MNFTENKLSRFTQMSKILCDRTSLVVIFAFFATILVTSLNAAAAGSCECTCPIGHTPVPESATGQRECSRYDSNPQCDVIRDCYCYKEDGSDGSTASTGGQELETYGEGDDSSADIFLVRKKVADYPNLAAGVCGWTLPPPPPVPCTCPNGTGAWKKAPGTMCDGSGGSCGGSCLHAMPGPNGTQEYKSVLCVSS